MRAEIAVLPGDGIGPEVTAAAVAVLREIADRHGHVFTYSENRIGGIAIDECGEPLPKATIDNTLVKAIARAFRWQAMLDNGTYGCIKDIARAERINGSFVSRVIRLALLAPDIVELVLAGRQPAALTLKGLMAPFPVEWERQRLLLL